MRNFAWKIVLLLFLLIGISGCTIIDYYLIPPPEDTAQELAEAGQDAMREKEFSSAIEYFTKLREKYPFSPYTPDAELSLADAFFLDGQYRAAAETYKEFEALHPRNEAIPYVLFQIGVANFKQFDSIDLPQHKVTEAMEYFKRVEELYPGTEYAQSSSDYIVKCRRYQAEHEVFVADFYWRTEKYEAAWQRYSYVAEVFQDLEDVREYASRRSRMAYFMFQKSSSETKRIDEGHSWRSWFQWL